jgi:hypothetical protein
MGQVVMEKKPRADEMMISGNGSRSTSVRRARRRRPVPLREPERRGEAQVDIRPSVARPVSFREAYYWDHPEAGGRIAMLEDAPNNATGDLIALYDKPARTRATQQEETHGRHLGIRRCHGEGLSGGRPKLTEEEKAARAEQRAAEKGPIRKTELSALQEAIRNLVEEVDVRVWRDGMSVMEALMDVIETSGRGEVEDIASLVRRNKDLKARLETECLELRLVKAEAA